jgi:hypothetical protein
MGGHSRGVSTSCVIVLLLLRGEGPFRFKATHAVTYSFFFAPRERSRPHQHARTIPQQTAIGRSVNIRLDYGGTFLLVPRPASRQLEGVAVPDIYDPTVNPLFRDVLAHYGVVALPCRIQDPIAKGKWSPASATPRGPRSKRMRFESLEEAQAYLDRWEQCWADTRVHGTTKRQVTVMFAEEKPHLLPLPLEPSVTTNTESASSIWTDALKSKPPITACRQDGSDGS